MDMPSRRFAAGQRISLAAVVVALVGALVLGAADAAGLPGHSADATSGSTTTTAPVTTTTLPAVTNPFMDPSIASYLAQQAKKENLTAALFDPASGQMFLYRPGVHEMGASIDKLAILGTLLSERELHKKALSSWEQSEIYSMIEFSSNDAANALWDDAGGATAVALFEKRIGMTETTCTIFLGWGELPTTARDQVILLKAITLPSNWLNPADQAYMQGLMEHVTPSEFFGVGATPKPAVVGLKNGWYPWPKGWQVNTDGFVHLGKSQYLLSIMSNQTPGEMYAINVLNVLSVKLWKQLRSQGWPNSKA